MWRRFLNWFLPVPLFCSKHGCRLQTRRAPFFEMNEEEFCPRCEEIPQTVRGRQFRHNAWVAAAKCETAENLRFVAKKRERTRIFDI